jgi:hypothetical protein
LGPTTTQLPLILAAMALGTLMGAKLVSELVTQWHTAATATAAVPTTPAKSEELTSHTANYGEGTESDSAIQMIHRQHAPGWKHDGEMSRSVPDHANVPGKLDLTRLGVPVEPGEQYACWLSTPCTSFCDYGINYNGGPGGSYGPLRQARTAAKRAYAAAHRDHRRTAPTLDVPEGNWERVLTSETREDGAGHVRDSLSFSQGDRIIRINREAEYDFWQWEASEGAYEQGWVQRKLLNWPSRNITVMNQQTQPGTASLLSHLPDVGMATQAPGEGEPPALTKRYEEK